MFKKTLNINCDLGEGMDNDEAIMPYIHSCNIACGGHFGDEHTIKKTLELARKYDLKVGAHPSFPDLLNFGRKNMSIPSETLSKSLKEQLNLFCRIIDSAKMKLHHIKLHGALYNLASNDKKTAETVTQILLDIDREFKVYAPPNSIFSITAGVHFEIIPEAFIDRTYQDDLTLTPRSISGATIQDSVEAWKQFEGLYFHNKIKTISGKIKTLDAATFCIHGDTFYALEQLQFIHKKINNA